MNFRAALAFSLTTLAACASRTPAPQTPAAVDPSPTSVTATVADASAVSDAVTAVVEAPHCPPRGEVSTENPEVLLVATDEGIREVRVDGVVLRTLTATPASHARYVGGGGAVVFLAKGRSELRRLSLEDCRETVVATLPRGLGARCEGAGFSADYDPTAYVQTDDAVELVDEGRALCVHVMDRNVNMMSVEVAMRVSLDDGALAHRVVVPASCADASTRAGDRLCAPATPAARRSTSDQPYAIEGNRIVRRAPRGRSVMVGTVQGSDVSLDEVSSSGRWQVFSANVSEGDVIVRDLLLFDAQNGRLHPIVEGDFAPALTAAQLRTIATVRGHTAQASGESTLRALDHDRLWIDGLLVTPGARTVRVGGSLAR